LHGFLEFVFVQRKGVFVVHDLELSGESNDASGTSGSELVLELLHKLVWR
jgi:hypothetical protein